MEQYKIFISYSWSNIDHQKWVLNLAERLVSDGVDVTLDLWDLKKGQDKFSFMETMVNSPDVKKVLMILDKQYQEKADNRAGGVGTETLIISPEVYQNTAQDKFVPIVKELDEEGNAYLPIYLKSRMYIDFSDQSTFEYSYEELLRDITQRPSNIKPKLGQLPSYLNEENKNLSKSTLSIRRIENAHNLDERKIKSLTKDFFYHFFEDLDDLKQFQHNYDVMEFGKLVCDAIHEYTPLRDNLVRFLDIIFKEDIDIDQELITGFFEKLHSYTYKIESSYVWDNDVYKFITHEIFLNYLALCLKHKRYDYMESVLYGAYYLKEYEMDTLKVKTYNSFYNHIDSIDKYYNSKLSKRFYSPSADLMVTRVSPYIKLINILDSDLICHYVARFNKTKWFPITYVYRQGICNVELLDKMISKKHFEMVKGIFNVQTPEEFLNNIKPQDNSNLGQRIRFSGDHFGGVPSIENLINLDLICTMK